MKKNIIKRKIIVMILACVVTLSTFSIPVSAAHQHQYDVYMTWKMYDGKGGYRFYKHFKCRNCDYGYIECIYSGGSRKF